VLYKVYAKILLNRLKEAGAEQRVSSRQFGFKSGCSTEDALYIVRRRIEQAWASRGGRTHLLALDWRKAFDSISPSRLMYALKRFGLNESMLSAIAKIYDGRSFHVKDEGVTSTERPQLAGISQGCPLSPFLFGMLMTVLMTDARGKLSPLAKTAFASRDLEDVLFADDTLWISTSGQHVEEYMAAVTDCGSQYGLQIHWDKVYYVPVCTQQSIRNPYGQPIPAHESMVYLGSTIHSNGKFGCEIGRKIGKTTATFRSLQSVWKHARISSRRKVHLFESLVLSQLRYALASAWLWKSDLRRLDGFQAGCLRQILGIPCSYVSRISNQRVREQCDVQLFSKTVRRAQLQLLGQVITNEKRTVLKDVTFHGETFQSETSAFVRRVGRPRQNWTEQLLAIMKSTAGSNERWLQAVECPALWNEIAYNATRVL
jgi:hypothetical protein